MQNEEETESKTTKKVANNCLKNRDDKTKSDNKSIKE